MSSNFLSKSSFFIFCSRTSFSSIIFFLSCSLCSKCCLLITRIKGHWLLIFSQENSASDSTCFSKVSSLSFNVLSWLSYIVFLSSKVFSWFFNDSCSNFSLSSKFWSCFSSSSFFDFKEVPWAINSWINCWFILKLKSDLSDRFSSSLFSS